MTLINPKKNGKQYFISTSSFSTYASLLSFVSVFCHRSLLRYCATLHSLQMIVHWLHDGECCIMIGGY